MGHETALQVLAEWDRLDREDRWPHAGRLLVAFRLALDVETCRALLAGESVDPDRLDQRALFEAQNRRIVLNVSEIDALEGAW